MTLLDKHGLPNVTIISQTKLTHTETVYNFEVQDFHTYHIGEYGVWVHNAECCGVINAFSKDNAFLHIDNFRKHKVGMNELGDGIPIKGDKMGTVAFVDINGTSIFGVNSSALVRDADKNLARKWKAQLGLNQGQGQVVFHAEAHSLMRAYQKNNGKLPPEINMFIDRKTCPNCRVQLPKLAKAMNIKKLNLFFKDGSEATIENGLYKLKP